MEIKLNSEIPKKIKFSKKNIPQKKSGFFIFVFPIMANMGTHNEFGYSTVMSERTK